MTERAGRAIDWSLWRTFLTVAETGGMAAAARAMAVNPSTISRQIEELEDRLGSRLIVRGAQGVALTEAGQRAYDGVLTMGRVAEALERETAGSDRLAEGRVKLSVPDGVAGYFLAPMMAEFTRAYPKIDLVIDCGLWPDKPLGGEVDLALTYTEPTFADAVARPVAHMHYALFASRAYLDLYGYPTTAAEVLAHPYLHHSAQDHRKSEWRDRAAAFQTMTNKRIETNSSAVLIEALRNGAGIAALPTAFLSIDPGLVMLDLKPLEPAKLWVVHHRDIGRSARIRAVIDWLNQVFDHRAKPWFRAEFVHPRDFLPLILGREAAAEEPAEQRRRRGMASKAE